jgi:hypothetical protein
LGLLKALSRSDCTLYYSPDSLPQSNFVDKKAQTRWKVVIGVEQSWPKDVDVDDDDGRNGSVIDYPFLVEPIRLFREERSGMAGGRWILHLVVSDRGGLGRGLGHSAMIHPGIDLG